MPFPPELASLINSTLQFASRNFTLLAIVGLGIIVIIFIRRWPDIATFTFLRAGVRAGKHVDTYRRDLAERIAEQGKRLQQAMAEQQLRIQAIHLERERIQQLVRTNPRLVKEVGQALKAVEREYLNSLKAIRSEQAKEVLRLATEKHINDILQSLNIPANHTPTFHVDDEKRTSGR